MAEQEFEVVTFDGAKLARYCGASFPEDRSLKADVYLSLDMFYDFEGSYAQVVPRFRPNWPTHQELADEALEDILLRGWQRKFPLMLGLCLQLQELLYFQLMVIH